MTLSELTHRTNHLDLRAALLSGYRRSQPLPTDHEPHLDTLIAWRELQLTHWFLEQRDHPAFEDWAAEVRGGLDYLRSLPRDATAAHPRH